MIHRRTKTPRTRVIPVLTLRRSRRLRLTQTDAERKLWLLLRDRRLGGAKFRRQHPVGKFIVDFCCPDQRLAIELDGGQHAAQTEADERRSRFLRARGYSVLRFWDDEVLRNPEAVLLEILQALTSEKKSPSP